MGSLARYLPGARPASAVVGCHGRRRRVASSSCRQLAFQQAEQRAAAVAFEDPIMGMLQAAEVQRLRITLPQYSFQALLASYRENVQ